jgi:hypothetical protein
MKATPAPRLQHRFTYRVPPGRTVSHLCPEVTEARDV